jgi:hypothetical protein
LSPFGHLHINSHLYVNTPNVLCQGWPHIVCLKELL